MEWINGPICRLSDDDLIRVYTSDALEQFEIWKRARDPGGPGGRISDAVEISRLESRLAMFREELKRRELVWEDD